MSSSLNSKLNFKKLNCDTTKSALLTKQHTNTPSKSNSIRIISPCGFDDYFDYFETSPFKSKKSVRFSQTVRVCIIPSRHDVNDAAYNSWWDSRSLHTGLNSELTKLRQDIVRQKGSGIISNDTMFLLQTHKNGLDFAVSMANTWLDSISDFDAVTIESPIRSTIHIRRNRNTYHAST